MVKRRSCLDLDSLCVDVSVKTTAYHDTILFYRCNHCISDLAFCGTDMIPNYHGKNMDQSLVQCEYRYILFPTMLHPSSLNEELDMTCFL